MVTQLLNLKPRGLYRHPNPLSEVPPGAIVRGANVVQPREGLLDQRRGIKRYGDELTLGVGERPNRLVNFKDRRLLHYGTSLAYDSDGAGTWVDYSGTYTPPSGVTRIKFAEANKNIYFTTSSGIKKLASLTGTVGEAGTPTGLDTTLALNGASGFMNNNSQVAYRVVWGIKDVNENLILGAPSQRAVISNSSGGTRNVQLTITIPSGITTSHFYQVYRSQMTSSSTETPNDELQLVYESNPTAGEITAKSVTFIDITPDSLRGATLYTSPSQQGIDQSNAQPPLAKDLCVFKNMTLYANTVSKQRLILTLISVDGTGLVVGDTVTIGSHTYTGAAAENIAAAQFKVETALTPAENIEATALSLIRVINGYASNTTYYAYYLSSYNDLPGRFAVEERSIGGTSFAFTSNNGDAFNPNLPTSGTSVSTNNEAARNRVYISKLLQPEAVPILQYVNIGSADDDILRVIALRDSAFVWKTDGLYRIVGETPQTIQVSLFDGTVKLVAPDSAIPFDNQVYGWTETGIVAASDTGVAVLSRPIEADLVQLSQYTNFESATHAVGYESERTYWVFTVTQNADTYATQAYSYNSLANTWTGPHPLAFSCGVLGNDDDMMYLGSALPTNKYVYIERKTYTETDFADDEYAVTIVSSTGTSVQVASSADAVVGQTLKQGDRKAKVESIPDATHIVVSKTLAWLAGAATLYDPIHVEIQSAPITATNPGIVKQYSDAVFFFRTATFEEIDLGFSSNFATYRSDITASPVSEGLWGLFPWGGVPWGGAPPEIQPIRTYVPPEMQMCNWLVNYITHAEALSTFSYAGISIMFEPMSERIH
jgi:hypothetical protein